MLEFIVYLSGKDVHIINQEVWEGNGTCDLVLYYESLKDKNGIADDTFATLKL